MTALALSAAGGALAMFACVRAYWPRRASEIERESFLDGYRAGTLLRDRTWGVDVEGDRVAGEAAGKVARAMTGRPLA